MSEEAQGLAIETEKLIAVVWDKLEGWLTGFVEMLPNLAVALIVMIGTVLAARLASSLVRRGAERASTNQQVASLLTVITRLAVLIVGGFVALGILQLEKTVTSLLAGIGVVGLALGFAFQDIASNLMSGVIMAIREPFQLGDLVETHGKMGHVERVTLRSTVVRSFSGQLIIIPNKDVLQNPIVNYSRTGERRVEVPVGVSYADDLENAIKVARRAAEGVPQRDTSRDVDVIYTGFGDSSIDLSVRFWLDLEEKHSDYLSAQSNAIIAIKAAFDEAGISIPFPMRTIEFSPRDAAEDIGGAGG